jgi:hypothetical protein
MIDAEIRFAAPAFAGGSGQHAASSRHRYSPIGPAIGSARDAQICSHLASPSSRDPVKYPGSRQADAPPWRAARGATAKKISLDGAPNIAYTPFRFRFSACFPPVSPGPFVCSLNNGATSVSPGLRSLIVGSLQARVCGD